jgi:tripartite-type tricarboxylate transporter receptor subunit TctC
MKPKRDMTEEPSMTQTIHLRRILLQQFAAAVSLAIAGMLPTIASAAFPDKPIKIFATAAPGAATDITARLIAEHMTKSLKQPVLVENQGGGGGTIALATVARAPADGYTLALTATAFVASPFLYKKLPYDPETAFAPISQVVTFYNILVSYPGFPAKTLPEFINYAKSNPVSLGGGNLGGQSWIMLTKLNSMAGTRIEYIPYKGTGPALTDVMGGHINSILSDPASMKGQIADGKVRAIAVTTPKRTRAFPDVPAFAEAVPGYEQEGWLGLLAPAGTPKDVVARLQKAVAEALADPTVRQKLLDGDFGIVGSTPDDFAAFLKKEFVSYGNIIKSTGVTLDDPMPAPK